MSNPSAAEPAGAEVAASATTAKPPANLSPQTGPKETGKWGPKAARPQQQDLVFTWPHLVSIEAIQAMIMTIAFVAMSAVVNAPLLTLANPEVTPNPAKAPWYFLGLQELLLHMHPALAGVIVPAVVLLLLGTIPYIDRERRGTAVWFNGKKGLKIFWVAALFTAAWEVPLILVDQWLEIPGKAGSHGIDPLLYYLMGLPDWTGKLLVPSLFMVFIPWLLLETVQRRYQANTREAMIALYTFFFVSFIVLTVVGTAFRGTDMALVWPWQLEVPH